MVSYNFNDSIGDLLSDDSTDSFFDDPKLSTNPNSVKGKASERKSVSDIFGLSESNKETPRQTQESIENFSVNTSNNNENKTVDDWLGLSDSTKTQIHQNQEFKKTAKNVSFEEDDILATLGLNKKIQAKGGVDEYRGTNSRYDVGIKTGTINESTLLNDILGTSMTTVGTDRNRSDLSNIVDEKKLDNPKPKTIELQHVDADPLLAMVSDRRRFRPSRSGLTDPLGLFSNETKPLEEQKSIYKLAKRNTEQVATSNINEEKQTDIPGNISEGETKTPLSTKPKRLQTKSASNTLELPDWLGGVSVKTHKSEPNMSSRRNSLQQEIIESPEPLTNANTVDNMLSQVPLLNNSTLDSLLTQQKISTAHLEYQNTSLAMQQQESQLLMSLQLKKYEDKLTEMQREQQNLLAKQEQQFNSLLEKQLIKQKMMENNLKMQQERINNHIQLLIAQPSSISQEKVSQESGMEEAENISHNKYEEIINNLKQRHHEEIFLLEESYKKQINLLEQSMESTEKRLKQEIADVLESYQFKLIQIKAAHEEEVARYKSKIEEMADIQKSEIQLLKENHKQVVEEIRSEYSSLINNLKARKQIEEDVIGNSFEYIKKLDDSVHLLSGAGKALTEVQKKVTEQENILFLSRQENLKAKENEIELMRAALDKVRDTTETERTQLMGLVRTLETQLAEQNQNSREERWALQQAAATLVARTAALDRETEFNRTLLEREREQIKTLKETILAEQEHNRLQITEERLALQTEKSRLETAAKLNQTYDPQKCRAEIDAAVQVAKEAAELTDKERENLFQQQHEIEMLKRSLIDREQKLLLKEKELHTLARSAEYKIKESQRALDDAKVLEIRYNERLKDIQNQLVSLTSREKKLTEDKIAISKERLALQTIAQQTKKCGLCAIDTSASEKVYGNEIAETDFRRFTVINDPDILQLRLAMEDEHIVFQGDG